MMRCGACRGTGERRGEPCGLCSSNGYVPDDEGPIPRPSPTPSHRDKLLASTCRKVAEDLMERMAEQQHRAMFGVDFHLRRLTSTVLQGNDAVADVFDMNRMIREAEAMQRRMRETNVTITARVAHEGLATLRMVPGEGAFVECSFITLMAIHKETALRLAEVIDRWSARFEVSNFPHLHSQHLPLPPYDKPASAPPA